MSTASSTVTGQFHTIYRFLVAENAPECLVRITYNVEVPTGDVEVAVS